ncbi:NUDIX hydrolase [Clostridium sp. CF012]|uniref:NUDIX hydrolase n=1 Tax=Clostridium sp. CF012 TaxID=2843319 RepID=UPI001C0E2D71|nr:NUDIX domain-containing protein [Clostridium sp. CF012]MBU3144507.1 NUDIX domain-containing protein [Clostridium sp. CF012]
MDISFKTDEGRFNYRVAGIIIHDNKLLIMKGEHSPYYYIPGGRVAMNELSEYAIIREIKEELNAEVKVNRMLWVNENFFHEKNLD